jgi:integrase
MPLTLIPPRPGKTPYWYVRGTHCGVYLDRSTKFTVQAKARAKLKQWEGEIERGEFSGSVEAVENTFLDAIVRYGKAGGDLRFLGSYDEETGVWDGLARILGPLTLAEVTQQAIDDAAAELYPGAPAPTINRQVHTPVSAVLKHSGKDEKIKRPKGWRGKRRVTWLWPEQAFALFKAADSIDAEFGIFLRTLCYTGIRLSEATTGLSCDRLRLSERFAYLPETKNGDPQPVFLPRPVVVALANHPRGLDRPGQTVFRMRKCGRLYTWLDTALTKAGITLPKRTGFHVLRHTYATWMRRYGGLDSRDLVETGRWTDANSAAIYNHVVASEISQRADLLPTESAKRARGRKR